MKKFALFLTAVAVVVLALAGSIASVQSLEKEFFLPERGVMDYVLALRLESRPFPDGTPDVQVTRPLPEVRIRDIACCPKVRIYGSERGNVGMVLEVYETVATDLYLQDQNGIRYRIPRVRIETSTYFASVGEASSVMYQLLELVGSGNEGLDFQFFPEWAWLDLNRRSPEFEVNALVIGVNYRNLVVTPRLRPRPRPSPGDGRG